jgi:hypothetical protein
MRILIMSDINVLPETGYLRLKHIIGDHAANIPPIIPVSRSTWWEGVKTGRFPKPYKLGKRMTAWKAEDIRRLLDELEAENSVTPN